MERPLKPHILRYEILEVGLGASPGPWSLVLSLVLRLLLGLVLRLLLRLVLRLLLGLVYTNFSIRLVHTAV